MGSDKMALAWNQQASATDHMAPEMNAGRIAWLYIRGRFLIHPQYIRKYEVLVMYIPQKWENT